MRRLLPAIAVLIVLWLAVAVPALAQQRIALVVTNQNYTQQGAALTNTHRDGDLVKAALERVGFKVFTARDTVNETALLTAIGEHVRRLAEAGPDAVGFVYYSGHGAADRPDGANYLIPTGAPITHAAQLPLMAVRLDKITETLARVGRINFVVFDACRNVPLQRAEKDVSFKGWAPVKEQSGLLVAYATEPGNVAVDQSIYAKALAEEIVQPGREASSAFRAVARRVIQETGNKQAPQYLDRRLHDFEFAAAMAVPVPVPVPAPAPGPAPPAAGAAAPQPNTQVPPTAAAGRDPAASVPPGSGRSFRDCADCPEMVVVPAGSFKMGEGSSARDVTISQAFAVGKFEVTFDEWAACVAGGGCTSNRNPNDLDWGKGRRPVINVSWSDAKEYVAWLSRRTGQTYRLLTEAEWEYAARAGTTTRYSWGNEIGKGNANCSGCGSQWDGKQTAPVGSFKANPWGLHDMHGNVWELCEDAYDASSNVVGGGSWYSSPDNLRSSYRIVKVPDLRNFGFGFRVARVLSPASTP